MKPSEIIGEASNPTDFETFRRNAVATFPVVNKGNEREMAPAFRVVLKNDPDERSEVIKFEPRESRDIQEKVEIQGFLMDLQEEDPEKYGDLTLDDLEIEYVSKNRPNVKDGELQDNDVDTPIQQVLKHVNQIKDSERITVNNIRQVIKTDSPDKSKAVYFDKFLTTLIDNKDQPFKPFIVIDDVAALKRTGFKNESEILTEFGEVAGPVGLLSRSITGSATRMLGTFLGKNGAEPSTEDLQSKATIHFHPSKTHKLVDSYIEYEGRVLRASSKNAGEGLSGGSGASLDGLFSSIEEIIADREAKRRLQSLLRQPGYLESYNTLRLLSNNFSQGEVAEGMAGYVATFKLLNKLAGETVITDGDIKILKKLWADSSGKDTRMHDYRDEIGSSLGNQPDIDAVGMMDQFSDGLKSLFPNMIGGTAYGEPSTSGREKIKSNNDNKGWWERLKKAVVYKLAVMINEQPEFSNLCTFILNHGAFCQIDLRWSGEKTGGKNGIKITNITATWPSTAVDSVKILPLSRGGIKFKLAINDKNATPDSEYLNDLDYDFGYKNNSDLANKMMPSAADLFGAKVRDEPTPGEAERASSSPTAQNINAFFRGLATNKIIPAKNLPETPEERAEVATSLALKIVGGYTPEALVKSIRYGMNDIYSAVRRFGINEAADDDEDDDEESDGTSKIDPDKQSRSVKDVQEYKNLLEMLYNSLRVNEYLKDNPGDKTRESEYLRRVENLGASVAKVSPGAWSKFTAILEPRSQGREPEYNTDAMKKVTRAEYQQAVDYISRLIRDTHRNRDGILELARLIRKGQSLGDPGMEASLLSVLKSYLDTPSIAQKMQEYEQAIEGITEASDVGQRELTGEQSLGALYILKCALDARQSPDDEGLQEKVSNAINHVFSGTTLQSREENKAERDAADAAEAQRRAAAAASANRTANSIDLERGLLAASQDDPELRQIYLSLSARDKMAAAEDFEAYRDEGKDLATIKDIIKQDYLSESARGSRRKRRLLEQKKGLSRILRGILG